jgi:hypothetical protein
VPTFEQAAGLFLAANKATWKNAIHRKQWEATLSAAYCAPILKLPVDRIGTTEVLKVLSPLWSTTPATASRIRGCIERVLAFARAKGWRTEENVALWRGHLAAVLPAPRRVKVPGRHAALPYGEMCSRAGSAAGRSRLRCRTS